MFTRFSNTIFPLQFSPPTSFLIAGAGGGFDFLCGLPIALELETLGHEVHIANYSFTDLTQVRGATWHSDHLLEVNSDSFLEQGEYFPELLLAKWYRERRNVAKPVWCFAKAGVQPTLESYNLLVEKLGIDVVISVDGGVDGIFRGDEHDLGTPSMDSISVIATSLCGAPTRMYACAAFGTEGAEGAVSHAQALERMADLTKAGAFLGVGAVHRNSEAGTAFVGAVEEMFQGLPPVRRSIIVSTILAAMNGEFGRRPIHPKTMQNPPWLSPLTSLIWYFEADAVARMKLFYDDVLESRSVSEVAAAIETVRQNTPVRPFESIPI